MTIEEKVNKAVKIVTETLEPELNSIILYGSVARGEEVKKKSDINLLIVVGDTSLKPFKLLWGSIKKLKKLKVNPVIMSEQYISLSLDSFPLEFLDIATTGKVLYGKGIEHLTSKITKNAVRTACERELKSKLIALKRIYLHSRGKSKGLNEVIFSSLAGLRVILLGLHFLKDAERVANVVSLSEDAEIDTELLNKLEQLRKGELKLKRTELISIFEKYIDEIEKLTNWLDEYPQ